MEIQTQLYGSVSIVRISGKVKAAEMLVLRLEIEKKCKNHSIVLINIETDDIEKAAMAELLRVRALEKSSKVNIKIVALTLEEADAQDLPTALEQIDTFEAQRVVQILERRHAIEAMKAEIEAANQAICKYLSLPPETGQEQLEVAIAKIRGESNKQRYLLKSIEQEIELLKNKKRTVTKENSPTPQQVEQINSIHKRALAVLKAIGGA